MHLSDCHSMRFYHLIKLPYKWLIDDVMFVCLLDELILDFWYSETRKHFRLSLSLIKVSGLSAFKFIQKRLHYTYFPVKFTNTLSEPLAAASVERKKKQWQINFYSTYFTLKPADHRPFQDTKRFRRIKNVMNYLPALNVSLRSHLLKIFIKLKFSKIISKMQQS